MKNEKYLSFFFIQQIIKIEKISILPANKIKFYLKNKLEAEFFKIIKATFLFFTHSSYFQ